MTSAAGIGDTVSRSCLAAITTGIVVALLAASVRASSPSERACVPKLTGRLTTAQRKLVRLVSEGAQEIVSQQRMRGQKPLAVPKRGYSLSQIVGLWPLLPIEQARVLQVRYLEPSGGPKTRTQVVAALDSSESVVRDRESRALAALSRLVRTAPIEADAIAGLLTQLLGPSRGGCLVRRLELPVKGPLDGQREAASVSANDDNYALAA
jgi:hypothetical protein